MEDLLRNNPPDSDLRKAQLRMLEILCVLDRICKKHNLPYWLGYGTLLGAVRHGGFIPWDDDLDIAMMRKDYKKLLKILPDELPDDLSLQMPGERYYDLPFSKIRDKNSEISEAHHRDERYLQKGLFVDIFPVECAYPGLKKFVRFFYEKSYRNLQRRNFSSPKLFFKYLFYILMWPFGASFMFLARLFAHIAPPNTLVHGYAIKDSAIQKKQAIFPLTEIMFEGRKYPAPHNYDAYLKTLYGDYMKIPEEADRQVHFEGDIKFFDKEETQEKNLAD